MSDKTIREVTNTVFIALILVAFPVQMLHIITGDALWYHWAGVIMFPYLMWRKLLK